MSEKNKEFSFELPPSIDEGFDAFCAIAAESEEELIPWPRRDASRDKQASGNDSDDPDAD
jgi:hypothetical protein